MDPPGCQRCRHSPQCPIRGWNPRQRRSKRKKRVEVTSLFATYPGVLNTVATGSVADQHFRSMLIRNLMTKIVIPHEGRLCNPRSLQRSNKTSNTSKQVLLFWVGSLKLVFTLLDPDQADQYQCGSMRIRIHNTGCRTCSAGTQDSFKEKRQCKYRYNVLHNSTVN